jgi:hypothetical protein
MEEYEILDPLNLSPEFLEAERQFVSAKPTKIRYSRGTLASRKYLLKKHYNLSLEDYNLILSAQKSSCAICEAHETTLNSWLSVDHDHSNGTVRGLLCRKCNTGLGGFRDSVENLQKAIEYLENPPHRSKNML